MERKEASERDTKGKVPNNDDKTRDARERSQGRWQSGAQDIRNLEANGASAGDIAQSGRALGLHPNTIQPTGFQFPTLYLF